MSANGRNASDARSLEDWDTWIDRAIREAQRRGDFDNLPGAGKPLAVEENPFAGELSTAFGILKNAGMAPPWIELQKEINKEQARLETWLRNANGRWRRANAAEQARLRNEYRERIADLNRLLLRYNLSVPQAAGQLPMLRMQDELGLLGKE